MNSKIVPIFLIAAIVFISGCTQQSGKGNPSGNLAVKFYKGVSFSPKSYTQADMTDFFAKAKQAGAIVTGGDVMDQLSKAGGSSSLVASQGKTYGYTPVILTNVFDQSIGLLFKPLDDAQKQIYKQNAVDFVTMYKPKYFGIGIEINTLWEAKLTDFVNFAGFFSDVYDAVKAVSPDTEVFTVFQLERMKGMNGGLFGKTNDPSKAEWSLIDSFPKADLIVFTTYPGLIYKDPSEIPSDYYTEIASHTSKKIAFSEIGWFSGSSITGWESNEAEQAQFVKTFFNLTSDVNMEFAIWSFMYDPETAIPFNTAGMFYSNGTEKLAWNAWISS